MSVYNWLCLLSAPALLLAVIRLLFSRTRALRTGIQALLRDRLLQLYRYCAQKGGAEISERENFENMYRQYHALGANGVMDDVRDRMRALPIKKEGDK